MSPAFGAFISLLLATLCAGQQTQRSLVMVGGNLADDNEAIYGRFIELSGGRGVARIGIVTAASADPLDSALFYEEILQDFGALETYWVPVHEGNMEAAEDPVVADRVNEMTGFFFGGGDQARVINSFYRYIGDFRVETPVLSALLRRFEEGASIGGSSAGINCMGGGVMIKGGLSYEALKHGALLESELEDDLVYDPDGGLGVMNNVVFDSHFSERGREGRLMRLLSDTRDLQHGTDFGIGIDENTALVVLSGLDGSNPVGEVIGQAGVYFVDISSATAGETNRQWSISGVRSHYLREGDSINLDDWTDVTFAAYKSNLAGNENFDEAMTSDDIFSGNREDDREPPVLTQVATRLVDSTATSTWGTTYYKTLPVFNVSFTKTTSTLGYGGDHPDIHPKQFDISYHDITVDIKALLP